MNKMNDIQKPIPAIRPFEVWSARLPGDPLSPLKSGCRPVVVVSEESYEQLPFVTVVPLTGNLETRQLPTHALVDVPCLEEPKRALCEQVTTVEKSRLIRQIGCVEEPFDRFSLCRALSVHISLSTIRQYERLTDDLYS